MDYGTAAGGKTAERSSSSKRVSKFKFYESCRSPDHHWIRHMAQHYLVEIYSDQLARTSDSCAYFWMHFFSFYITLCAGCFASSQGASPMIILPAAMLLTVPNVLKQRDTNILTVETAAHSLNSLVFSAIAYGIGRGLASVLGS